MSRRLFYVHAHTHAHTQARTHAHTHARAHTHTHMGTHTHNYSDYTKLNLHSLKRAPNREMDETAAWNRKHGRSTVLEKEMFFSYV